MQEDDGERIEAPKIDVEVAEERYGKFIMEPLEPGHGVTVGNTLRRALYNSLQGTAITWVKIEGVVHEYDKIPHVKEEVLEFLLNVKGIRLRSDVIRQRKLRLEVAGEGEVSAADIMAPSDIEVVNPELHLATLNSEQARLSVEFNVQRGKGYVPAGQGAEAVLVKQQEADAQGDPVVLDPGTRQHVRHQRRSPRHRRTAARRRVYTHNQGGIPRGEGPRRQLRQLRTARNRSLDRRLPYPRPGNQRGVPHACGPILPVLQRGQDSGKGHRSPTARTGHPRRKVPVPHRAARTVLPDAQLPQARRHKRPWAKSSSGAETSYWQYETSAKSPSPSLWTA